MMMRSCRDLGTAVILVARWRPPQTAACHVRRQLPLRPGAAATPAVAGADVNNLVIKN